MTGWGAEVPRRGAEPRDLPGPEAGLPVEREPKLPTEAELVKRAEAAAAERAAYPLHRDERDALLAAVVRLAGGTVMVPRAELAKPVSLTWWHNPDTDTWTVRSL